MSATNGTRKGRGQSGRTLFIDGHPDVLAADLIKLARRSGYRDMSLKQIYSARHAAKKRAEATAAAEPKRAPAWAATNGTGTNGHAAAAPATKPDIPPPPWAPKPATKPELPAMIAPTDTAGDEALFRIILLRIGVTRAVQMIRELDTFLGRIPAEADPAGKPS
jgi:hypothetical protein